MKQLLVIIVSMVSGIALAEDVRVTTQAEYRDAVKQLEPGDTIVLADGVWRDFEIRFSGRGQPGKPITLRAETSGKVIISGVSNLRLSGEHLLVSGLVFRNGHTPTNEVISFRRSKDELANNSRVTEVVIDHFNNPERYESDSWVMLYGRNNRVDHSHFEGKSNVGVTMAVRLDSEASQNNHHRIDHNYFGPRPVLGSNGGETLRLGTSHYSLTDSHTVVENNFFDRCNGEVEIVSNKSGKNVFRNNVFFESRGTLTLRHGNGNLVEGNVFLGNGVDHTGGIRVINKHQTVRNNYLSGLTGHRFGGGLVVMNGVPDSPINRYHQVEDTVIENNSIIDVEHIELAAGSDAERSAVPLSTLFRNNLIVNAVESDTIAVHDDISGITFEGNVASGVAKLPSETGFDVRAIELAKAPNGLLYPVDDSLAGKGAAPDLDVIDRDATGPGWYPKPGYGGKFDTGKVITVRPGQDTLTDALAASAPGDRLELQPGDYLVTKILAVQHPVTVASASDQRPALAFERSTMFEIVDGGSLRLERLAIDGSLAPDGYGNSVVRTSRYSMLDNYELEVIDSVVENLNTNHSFNFLRVSKHTFAGNIAIRKSSFSDVSGHIIALDREIDDLGIYNGEYVSIEASDFENIGGAVVNAYRGGTDESTFGPHVSVVNSTLISVGNDKRNKTRASIFLHGVQVASISGNEFRKSRPIRVVETVGEPVTTIRDNKRSGTPEPEITSTVM